MVPEEIIKVQTVYGPVQFRGRDTGRPLLLFISGVLAEEKQLYLVQQRFPDVDVLRAFLPGNHSPPLVGVTIDIYAAAYSSALEERFPGRDLVVVGLSVGALVVFALRSRGIREIVAVEPILVMEEAWPLKVLREQAPPGYEVFLWNILGIGPERTVPRDYRRLLAKLEVPVCALLGDAPPPEGPWSGRMPGLVGPLSRAALAGYPRITIRDFPGIGHNVVRDAPIPLLTEVQSAIRRTFGEEAATPDLG